tara:strand:+ start:445 stop:1569 length:1125 start_codon:yes stop_codon:yes gene_type:complete
MKFTSNSNELLKQIQSISGILNSNNALPILDNFLFEIKKENLTISASDLASSMSVVIDKNYTCNEEGNIAIPAKLLLDILKTFSNQILTFIINNDNFSIEISSENGNYNLAGENAEDFPKVTELSEENEISMPSEDLLKAINYTTFCTSADESIRPVMSGVFMEIENEKISFVATDAHKLTKYTYYKKDINFVNSFIIPKKPLQVIKHIIDDSLNLKINFNESNIFFSFANFKISCRLIEGKYPDYNAVIPTENPYKLQLDKSLFLNSLKRVSLFSNKSSNAIKLKIAGSEIIISSEDLDFSNKAEERLECKYEGDNIEIGFNSKFLIELLNHLDENEIEIKLDTPNSACIITRVNEVEKDTILMLIMPIMLNN